MFYSENVPNPSACVSTDAVYADLLVELLTDGSEVVTRNSKCRRVIGAGFCFRSTPLVSLRKTSWKNALREWEWFMSGSNSITELHDSVRPWWKPFCNIDQHTLPHNYGKAFRRLYVPGVGPVVPTEPSLLQEDPPADVPTFPRRQVTPGSAKHLGYEGQNHHGDRFRVVEYLGDSTYLLQFDSNGYCVRSKPSNFLSGAVKNPYYPTVLGVGCFGVVHSDDYTYYQRGYRLWSDMMNRCYNEERRHYRWYHDIKVCARWKVFEYFIADLHRLPGFEEWLASPGEYALDKDYKMANYYGPDVCVFLPVAQNSALALAERFYPVPRRSLEIDQIQNLIDGVRDHPFSRRNVITTWIPSHVQAGLLNPTACHGTIVQAFVEPEDDSLHLITYQRSADVVCGLPHNWIQYWAFLLWLAHRTSRKVGSLLWVGGDVHLYEAHYSLARNMVTARATASVAAALAEVPDLVYTPTTEEFRADDFSLSGPYNPILLDRAEMIV